MAKDTQIKNSEATQDKRLQEIAETMLGTLSDDEVAGLLAERKHLLEREREILEQQKKEEVKRLELEKQEEQKLQLVAAKKKELLKGLAELNQSISSDKTDSELLFLVKQRKTFEQELKDLGKNIPQESVPVPVEPLSIPEEKVSESASPQETVVPPLSNPEISSKEQFGQEEVQGDDIEEGEFQRYMDQLKSNTGSLGALLQNMPQSAKKSKIFMLKVAETDPAYAMHFADSETLKKDEAFNIRVASLKNPRNSGNALAEMLPEARTSKVVMAAVRQDYLNVKFIRPAMEGYDEILGIAKKEALAKIRQLKDAADVLLLVPKPLQQDAEFMKEIKSIASEAKSKQVTAQ